MLPLARLSLPPAGVASGAADGAFAAAHADRTCGAEHDTRPHAALAELEVCLHCASGFNTGCGFFNYALTHMRAPADFDREPGAANSDDIWHWQMFTCACSNCESATANSAALGANESSADRRRSLLDRHRVRKLDLALAVDEPPDDTARRVPNAVPVLLLRQWLLRGADGREPSVPFIERYVVPRVAQILKSADCHDISVDELFRYTFCSFDRTALWLASANGGRAWMAFVHSRADLLRSAYQIECDNDVLNDPKSHMYMAAALLRLSVSYEMMHWAQLDLRSAYRRERSTQHTVLALQLFADTHLDLFVFCTAVHAWNDKYLTLPTSATLAETEYGAALRTSDAPEARAEWRSTLLPECALLSPLERFYPHPLRAPYGGNLIDVSSMFSYANIWTQTRKKAKNATMRFVHVMLCKMQNHKCLIRDHATMLSAELGRQPVLIDFVMNLLEVSQLGNYEGTLLRPKWLARCAIRRSHHADRHELQTWCARCSPNKRVPCPECGGERPPVKSVEHAKHLCDLCAFIDRNARTILFASKEFYVYTVRMTEIFDSILSSESGWREHRELVTTALNDARRTLSGAFDLPAHCSSETLRQLMVKRIARAQANIERQLRLIHDVNKPTLRRLHKRLTFYELLQRPILAVHNHVFVSNVWSGCQEPADFLIAPLAESDTRVNRNSLLDPARLMEIPSRERFPGHFVCETPLEHLDGARWCDIYMPEQVTAAAHFCERTYGDFQPQLLATIGASPAAIEALQTLRYESVERDLPDNRVRRFCEDLARDMPVDFMIMAHFVAEMEVSAAVKVQYIDNEQARAQARALRLRMRVEPWEPLPPGCDRIWFCRQHGVAYCDPVEPAEYERDAAAARDRGDGSALALSASASTYGPTGAIYSHALKGLVCARGRYSSGAHRWSRVGMLDLPMYADNSATQERNASIRSTRRSVRQCDNHLLESRSLLGAVVRVGRDLFTLCVKCGATCLWRDECMTAHGMTCGREVRFSVANCYTDLRELVSARSQQIRSRAPPGSGATQNQRRGSCEEAVESQLLPLFESLPMPPMPLNERGDAFERITTPIFDSALEDRREQQLIEALGFQETKRLTNGVRKSALAQRKQKMLALLDADYNSGKQEADDDASASETDEQNEPVAPKLRQHSRGRQSLKPATSPHERHLRRPNTHTEQEWAELDDEDKFYRTMKEGETYWRSVCALRRSTAPDRDTELRKLHIAESERRGRLSSEKHYDKEMARLRAATKIGEMRKVAERRVHVDHLSDAFVLRARDLFARVGYIEVRLDIVCAYCRARCERRSHFTRVPLQNANGTLVDSQTGRPLEQLGMLHIWLCIKCFGNAEQFLRERPATDASALYRHLNKRRNAAFQRRINYLIKNR